MRKAAFVENKSLFGVKIQGEFGRESCSCYSSLHQITLRFFLCLEKSGYISFIIQKMVCQHSDVTHGVGWWPIQWGENRLLTVWLAGNGLGHVAAGP